MSNRGVRNILSELEKKLEVAKNLLSSEKAEKWDRKYINDLPNAAFAAVEKGYKEGKDKRAKHLPHHSKGVKSATENSTVDLPHYRNALARTNQIKSVLKTESDSALRKRAASHLEKHRTVLSTEKSNFGSVDLAIWEECEKLFLENVVPLLSNDAEGGE